MDLINLLDTCTGNVLFYLCHSLSRPLRTPHFVTTEPLNMGCLLPGGISPSSLPYWGLLFQELKLTPPPLGSWLFLLHSQPLCFVCIRAHSPLDAVKQARGTWLLRAPLGQDGVSRVTAAPHLTRGWFSINSCGRFSVIGRRQSPVCLQRSQFTLTDTVWL